MTKTELVKRPTKSLEFIFVGILVLWGCSSPENRIYKEAISEMNQGHFHVAVDEFDKVVRRSPQSIWGVRSAREAARISLYETKDYKRAVEFLKSVVLYSKDAVERLQSQKLMAGIYFDNLQNYSQAIQEYVRLLQIVKTPSEEALYRTNIGRSYYYLNNFDQAETEIKELLKLKIDPAMRFAAYVLNGNILVAKKEFSKAADIYKQLIAEYPDRAMQENIPLSLAVCYEENNDFPNAVKTLESLIGHYNPPEYIELRIKRLKERQKNQPGAKGFHK